MEKTQVYKGKKYSLRTVNCQPGTVCPGCAFGGRETFCVRLPKTHSPQEKELDKGCRAYRPYGVTPIWVEIPYPWYERFWNWITRKK